MGIGKAAHKRLNLKAKDAREGRKGALGEAKGLIGILLQEHQIL